MKGPAPPPASAGKSYRGASGRKLSAAAPATPGVPPKPDTAAAAAMTAAMTAASKLNKLAAAKGDPGDKETSRGGKQGGDLATDVDELARLLEHDKNALMKMRHDLEESHEQEMQRFREELRRVKWSYDHLRVANNAKEKKLLELAAGLRKYQGVSAAEAETGQKADEVKKGLNTALSEAEEDLAAEQRAQRMLSLMAYRLDEETNDLRAEVSRPLSRPLSSTYIGPYLRQHGRPARRGMKNTRHCPIPCGGDPLQSGRTEIGSSPPPRSP